MNAAKRKKTVAATTGGNGKARETTGRHGRSRESSPVTNYNDICIYNPNDSSSDIPNPISIQNRKTIFRVRGSGRGIQGRGGTKARKSAARPGGGRPQERGRAHAHEYHADVL